VTPAQITIIHWAKAPLKILSAIVLPLLAALLASLLATVILPFTNNLYAQIDPVTLAQQHSPPPALRWDNINAPPFWLDGEKPRYQHSLKMHTIQFTKNNEVLIRLPAYRYLRLHTPEQALRPQDWQVTLSNGSGIWLNAPLQRTNQATSLIISQLHPQERLVRLRYLGTDDKETDIALYLSRPVPSGNTAPYQHSISLNTNQHTLRREHDAVGMPYWRVDPVAPAEINLQGPARYELTHRSVFFNTGHDDKRQYESQHDNHDKSNNKHHNDNHSIRNGNRYNNDNNSDNDNELDQVYHLDLTLNGKPFEHLPVYTTAETKNTLYVDNTAQPLSRATRHYLEIPEGNHTLGISTTQPVLARLNRQTEDYLAPSLNAPEITATQVREQLLDKPVVIPGWPLDPMLATTRVMARIDQIEGITAALVNDNTHRDNRLSAAMFMQSVANKTNNDPQLTSAAQHLAGNVTFYRNLFPEKPTPATSSDGASTKLTTPGFQSFYSQRLLGIDENPDQSITIATQHSHAALRQTNRAYFTPIPEEHQQAQHYPVPQRETVSTLRLILNQSAMVTGGTLFLQYDDEPVMPLRVEPTPTLSPNHYAPSLTQAALTVLALSPKTTHVADDNIGSTRKITPGGDLNETNAAINLVTPAAVLVLPLPAKIRNIKLWQAAGAPIHVALQYRSSKPDHLKELNYLRNRHAAAGSNGFDSAQRRQLLGITPVTNLPAMLINDWRPIARRLSSQQKRFSMAISPIQAKTKPYQQLSPANWKKHHQRARQAEQQQQWLTALEQWSIIARGTRHERQRESQAARIAALQQLGEVYLSNRLLKGWFLYADDPPLSNVAKQRLITEYTRTGNTTALMGLWASAVLRQPDVDNILPYIKLLLEQNQYQHALLLALALPPAQQPKQLLMLAAYKLKWWHVFETTLVTLPPDQQQLWSGYRAFQQGRATTAQTHWRHAGEQGQQLIDFFRQGKNIINSLYSPEKLERQQAMPQWTQWQHRHPGPHHWQPSPELVTDHQGMAYLYAVEQDRLAPAFRASQTRPVNISVQGPVTLRFLARTLHDENNPTPINDWLIVRQGQQSTVLPINNNRPTQGLTLVSSGTTMPGAKLEMEYTVEPGFHELSISATHHTLLLQVYAQRPQLPLDLLSPLAAREPVSTLFASLDASRSVPPETAFNPTLDQQPVLVNGNLSCRSLTSGNTIYRCQREKTPAMANRNHSQNHENGVVPSSNYAAYVNTMTNNTVHNTDTKALSYKKTPNHHAGTIIVDPLSRTTPTDATGKLTDVEVRHLMTKLLWQVEQSPNSLPQWLPVAEQLFQQHGNVAGLKSIYTRLSKGLGWQLTNSVSQSAGLYYAEHQGWNPESPALRIRKALLGINNPNAHIISGSMQYGMGMTNLTATNIRVRLQRLDLPFTPGVTTTVRLRLNKKVIHDIILDDKKTSANLSVKIPPGEHAIRIALVDPVINQFLKITLQENTRNSNATLTRSTKRAYHVATATEPVQVHIQGPVRLRIDEWSRHQVNSRYQSLGAGWHDVVLKPADGVDHTYFRIYQRTPIRDNTPPRQRPPVLIPITPKAAPLLAVTTVRQTQGPYTVVDNLPLGQQEDGTWSWSADIVSRRQIDEDRSDVDDAEQFLQLNATHRYFSAHKHRYTKHRVLARIRDTGGTTLGLQSGLHYQPRWKTWRATLQGNLYAQDPDKTIGNAASHMEWSANIRGSISQFRRISANSFHLPKVSLFQRKLSLKDFKHYLPDAVDQDIFSRYKHDHQRGIVIGDSYTHQPWPDTEWNLAGNITSNEPLNPLAPDYLDTRLTWKQLLGAWRVKAQYGHRHYFDDRHRSRSLSRNQLSIDIDGLYWHSYQQRWQLQLQFRHDVEPSDNSLQLTIAWHGGHGRAFQDFWPGEIDFRQRQYRQAMTSPNNHIYGRYADE